MISVYMYDVCNHLADQVRTAIRNEELARASGILQAMQLIIQDATDQADGYEEEKELKDCRHVFSAAVSWFSEASTPIGKDARLPQS